MPQFKVGDRYKAEHNNGVIIGVNEFTYTVQWDGMVNTENYYVINIERDRCWTKLLASNPVSKRSNIIRR